MLRNLQVSASGLSRSRLERPVYIPCVWLPSNILCLITDDAAIPDKHIKDKHSLLSVMSWSSLSSSSSTACLETFSLHCHVSMTAEDIPHAAHPSLQITASLPLQGHRAGSTKQGGKTKLRRKKTSHPMSVFCQIAVEISPTSLLKCLKRFGFLFSSIHVCDECGDRTMVFLPDIVCRFWALCFSSWAETSANTFCGSPAVVRHQFQFQEGILTGLVPKPIIVGTNILWFL